MNRCEFRIRGHGLTVVTGRNGAGKTTLMRAMAGLCRADGVIAVNGVELAARQPCTRVTEGLVLLPQVEGTFPNLTWHDHLRVSPRPDVMQQALDSIVSGPFDPDQAIGLMSGGQRRSASIAYALSLQPKVLLLDEPTAGLDDSTKQAVRHVICNLAKEIRVVMVEHDAPWTFPRPDTWLEVRREETSLRHVEPHTEPRDDT